MRLKTMMSFALVAALLGLMTFTSLASAKSKGKMPMPPPAVYTDNCGTCHMAYPAWLLPAASWNKVMAGLDNHFGDSVSLSDEDNAAVTTWLQSQAAGTGQSELGDKVAKRMGSETPLRVTETAWFVREHRKEKAPQGFSACESCHKDAARGIFED